MPPNSIPDPAARIDHLERELNELRLRLAALERLLDERLEHPTDRKTVRQKVTYDWQD